MWQGEEADRAPAEFPPRWAALYGDDPYGLWADLDLSPTVRFRWIEPGWFWMGSSKTDKKVNSDEMPCHIVQITEGFWLAETPITVAQWNAVMGEKKEGKADHPVTEVSWDAAEGFMKKVQPLMVGDDLEMTFPTEAQWEYACRAGTIELYWWGDEAKTTHMNVGGQYKGTTPVKNFAPNPWGLYDMHGNVWEWCLDQGLRKYQDKEERNPISMNETEQRVQRGGSWNFLAEDARAASRNHLHRFNIWNNDGFRPVLRSLQGLAGREGGLPAAQPGETPSDTRRGKK
jgi:formylglycine-generating enzyme